MLAVEFVDELLDGVLRVSLPLIRDDLGLTYVQVGLLFTIPDLVASVVEPFIGLGADLWKRRWIIAAGGIGFAAATGLIAGAQGFVVLLAGMILFFPSSGAFVSISQASLMDADPARREQNMARWTAAGGAGNILGPLLVTLAVAVVGTWRGAYVAMSVLAMLALARMLRFPITPTREPHESIRHAFVDAFKQLRRKEVLRWLTVLKAADLMLDILTAFLALYLVDVVGMSVGAVAVVFVGGSIAGTIAELGVVWLLERIPGLLYLRVSLVLTLALYPLLLVLEPVWAKVTVAIVIDVVTAGWYSISQARLYGTLPDRSGTALALSNVYGIAWTVVPVVLGWIAERHGLTTTMWVLLIGPVIMIAALIGVPLGGRGQPQGEVHE